MKSVIVGTAGHIDHGKTALVNALTGTDAADLAEVTRRYTKALLGYLDRERLTLCAGEERIIL